MIHDDATEAVFPIRVVAEKTGINPVTLRAWERRYGLVRPQRTAKGHRLYSEHDIHTITRILELLQQGAAISRVKDMLEESDTGHAPGALPHEPGTEGARTEVWTEHLRRMVTAVSAFDERALEATYSEAISVYPVDLVTRLLLEPLLHELTVRWEALPHAEAERRFLQGYLRNKLGARFHYQSLQSSGARLLLAGLPGEHVETPILMLALAVVSAGYRAILLGADCPLEVLEHACARADAAGLVVHADLLLPQQLLGQLRQLSETLPCPVFVGGNCTGSQRTALQDAGLIVLDADAAGTLQALRNALPAPD